jgi:hypothetical protein
MISFDHVNDDDDCGGGDDDDDDALDCSHCRRSMLSARIIVI